MWFLSAFVVGFIFESIFRIVILRKKSEDKNIWNSNNYITHALKKYLDNNADV